MGLAPPRLLALMLPQVAAGRLERLADRPEPDGGHGVGQVDFLSEEVRPLLADDVSHVGDGLTLPSAFLVHVLLTVEHGDPDEHQSLVVCGDLDAVRELLDGWGHGEQWVVGVELVRDEFGCLLPALVDLELALESKASGVGLAGQGCEHRGLLWVHGHAVGVIGLDRSHQGQGDQGESTHHGVSPWVSVRTVMVLTQKTSQYSII